MNTKLITALGAIGAYALSIHLMDNVGFNPYILTATGIISATAIALICVEWARK